MKLVNILPKVPVDWMKVFEKGSRLHHIVRHVFDSYQGCARFPEFTQNFSERQILWSLCSVDFTL